MGTVVDYKSIKKDSRKDNENRPKSDPLDLVLNKNLIVSKAEITVTKYGDQALLYTDLGTFRSTSKRIVEATKESIIPALENGDQIRVKPVRRAYQNGNRGYDFAGDGE